MKFDLETVTRKLSEWKEKILFGAVLLLTASVATNASPLGGGIERIDAEARQAALVKTEVDEGRAMSARDALVKPPDVSPTPVKAEDVTALFFHERSAFSPSKSSGWMLGQESFEKLPPLPLVVPGISPLTDFDLPAGPMPALDRARGMVPRDGRAVVLTTPETSEFKD